MRMFKRLLYIFFICLVTVFSVQSIESLLPVDSEYLDGNSIKAPFRNNGNFNRDPTTANAGFEWPRNSGKTARYSSGLWIGAVVGNDTVVSAAAYNYSFLPGYTEASGVPAGYDSSSYRIYKMIKGVNNDDRANWPNRLLGNSHQGAPVYYDSLIGIHKPVDFGNQTMYYSYTDSYAESRLPPSSPLPLKADVKQLNFVPDGFGLDHILITHFIIINRSTQTWNNTVFSFWTDDDLGTSDNDKIGCDSSLKLGYTYNGTPTDGMYGATPPAVGTILLKGAETFTGNSSDVVSYCNSYFRTTKTGYRDGGIYSFNAGLANNHIQAYRLMNGLTTGGAPQINPSGNFTTRLSYSGDPVAATGWNQSAWGEQRFLLSTGPVNVAPGDTQTIIVGQLMGGGSTNLLSITDLRNRAAIVKEYFRDCYDFDPVSISENELTIDKFSLSQNYPNPFNPSTKIKFEVPEALKTGSAEVSLIVYDIAGKEISSVINSKLSPGNYEYEWNTSGNSSGIYFYRLTVKDGSAVYSASKSMILLK